MITPTRSAPTTAPATTPALTPPESPCLELPPKLLLTVVVVSDVAGDDGIRNASAATICADVNDEPTPAAHNVFLSIDESVAWRFVFRADRLVPPDAELTRRGDLILPADVVAEERDGLAPELFGR